MPVMLPPTCASAIDSGATPLPHAMLDGVALIQTMTFRLVADVDDATFKAADARVQSDFAYQQPGLVRRTTASGTGDRLGEWITIDLWRSAEDADAAGQRWGDDPAAKVLTALIDAGSVDVRRYTDLD